jgi:hypothetical protein
MLDTKDTVARESANRKASGCGKRSGGLQRRAEITFTVRSMCSVYKSGEKAIRGTGGGMCQKGKMRYKTTALRNILIVKEICTT